MRIRTDLFPPLLAMVLLSALSGCRGGEAGAGGGSSNGAAPAVKVTAADRKEAHDLFMTLRSLPLDNSGEAMDLAPRDWIQPRNYADADWQKTVTDEEIEKAIVYGGTAVGKSAQMVANPDLQAKPAVVAALREMVRSFGEL